MVAEEEVVVTLSGGAPWGFRLQGGTEQKRPLQVSKIRKRSKACRGGLWENDELVSINGKACAGLSHAAAMQIIDSCNGLLSMVVKRTISGDLADGRLLRSPSPKQLQGNNSKVVSPPPLLGQVSQVRSPEPTGPPVAPEPEQPPGRKQHMEHLTSPPDSEAYYAETDSDADNIAQEKHRRARKKSPRSPPEGSNHKAGETQDEVSMSELSGYDSTPEAVAQAGESGVAKREIVCQPESRTDTPFSESEALLQPLLLEDREASPEAMLLPHATKTIRAERHLIPMIGPVEHPVDEDLTTSYMEKAKQAKLHRSESMQEKNVKEAKTKCRTIASLLTDAPNPHSKGVLMFKKRRQRAKKYTLVSFGSVDEDRCYDEEDGVFPTSESEFDEEGFSDARSFTNHSDWDNTYLDIEKPKGQDDHKQAPSEQGLTEASGRGVQMFEQQREKAGKHTLENVTAQTSEEQPQAPAAPLAHRAATDGTPTPHKAEKAPLNVHLESIQVSRQLPSPNPAQLQSPTGNAGGGAASFPTATNIFNRSARPFTPGLSGERPVTSSVVFRPSAPKKTIESLAGQRTPVPSFSPGTTGVASAPSATQPNGPASASVSLYIPTTPSSVQPTVGGHAGEAKPPSSTARTSTASIYLSTPAKPAGGSPAAAAGPPPRSSQPQETASYSVYVSPAPQPLNPQPAQPFSGIGPAIPQPTPEPFASREQRVSVPAPRTGILQEARRRSGKKPMFKSVEEKKKNSPNPELLSLVQNLDEKPKAAEHHGAGFESGPEEDFLSLGAEACNFMQSSARRFKTPPPVAPKPQPSQANGLSPPYDISHLRGKGAELFAKRQSRMDRFVVEAPTSAPKPRTPSPAPSLPSSWKYSPNIRAPPPIAYNPLLSPFYPLAASKTQASKAESKVKKAPSQKSGIKAIDFMRHQPYQLNSAMFCFGETPSSGAQATTSQTAQQSSLTFTPTKQAPVKTARTYEIRRFSTPAPGPASGGLAPTVLAPRSATTLDEPVWRTEMASTSAPVSPGPFQVAAPQYQSSPELSEAGRAGASPSRPSSSSSSFQVARPRFSAAQTGMQAHVWRPGSTQH